MLLQSTRCPHLHSRDYNANLTFFVCMQTATMVRLALMLGLVIIEPVYGIPPLPPLPMKGGCYHVFSEMDIFRVEGEAVILDFPMFERVLKVRNIAPPTANYLITKANSTEVTAYQGEGRVQQRNKKLWFLPAQASDSGEYICTYGNETYCVTGRITLHVYKSNSVDIDKVSYPISATVGENLTCECPSLNNFSKADTVIKWYKLGSKGSFHQDHGNLKIPFVTRSHAGLYTCQLSVLINNQQYKVSRALQLHVQGPDPGMTTTVPDHSLASDPGRRSSSTAVHSLISQPPVILSPLNGTIFESLHGSGLELICTVLAECEMADSTMVTWLVNGQSVELSDLNGRVLLRERKVTRVSEGCLIDLGLTLIAMTEEEVKTELKCATQNQGGSREVVIHLQLEDSTFIWLVVAAVAFSCFLTVVSIFIYVVFEPERKKKMDYILARQNSTF